MIYISFFQNKISRAPTISKSERKKREKYQESIEQAKLALQLTNQERNNIIKQFWYRENVINKHDFDFDKENLHKKPEVQKVSRKL